MDDEFLRSERLTDENYLIFCAKHYNQTVRYSTDDFYEDLKRVRYIKKLLTRFQQTGELKERLILNHIIILNNSFGPTITAKILFFKLSKQRPLIKPFLLYLSILPERIYNVGSEDMVDTRRVLTDVYIEEILRKL